MTDIYNFKVLKGYISVQSCVINVSESLDTSKLLFSGHSTRIFVLNLVIGHGVNGQEILRNILK